MTENCLVLQSSWSLLLAVLCSCYPLLDAVSRGRWQFDTQQLWPHATRLPVSPLGVSIDSCRPHNVCCVSRVTGRFGPEMGPAWLLLLCVSSCIVPQCMMNGMGWAPVLFMPVTQQSSLAGCSCKLRLVCPALCFSALVVPRFALWWSIHATFGVEPRLSRLAGSGLSDPQPFSPWLFWLLLRPAVRILLSVMLGALNAARPARAAVKVYM